VRIADAQRELRTEFAGGFFGQAVSSVLWFTSAALATWSTPRSAIIALVAGGFFIFPVTYTLLRVTWRRPGLSKDNTLGQLGMQVAFVLPLSLPLVAAAALYRLEWFYPAFMIALGAHYLPFVFLYGMRMFAMLAGLLVGAGMFIGLHHRDSFAMGGWFTAALLLVFAFVGLVVVYREERGTAS
jgi:hypothetical protein